MKSYTSHLRSTPSPCARYAPEVSRGSQGKIIKKVEPLAPVVGNRIVSRVDLRTTPSWQWLPSLSPSLRSDEGINSFSTRAPIEIRSSVAGPGDGIRDSDTPFRRSAFRGRSRSRSPGPVSRLLQVRACARATLQRRTSLRGAFAPILAKAKDLLVVSLSTGATRHTVYVGSGLSLIGYCTVCHMRTVRVTPIS